MENNASETPSAASQAPPRPSWLLIVFSLVNMLIGVVTAAVGLVGLELVWPMPTFVVGGIIMTLFGLGTTFGQYLGTFRRSPFGANLAAFLPGFCLITLLAAQTVAPLFLSLGGASISETEIITESGPRFIYVVIYTFVSMGVNVYWLFKLKAYAKQSDEKTKLSFSLLEILGLCILLAAVIAPVSYSARSNPAMYLENVSAAEVPLPLPAGAENVAYQRNRYGVARATYEVNEEVLKNWLLANPPAENVEQQEITASIQISIPNADQPLLGAYVTVTQGFQATWKIDNRYFTLVYDRPSGTAYYEEAVIPND